MHNLMVLTDTVTGLDQQWVTDFLGLFTSILQTVFLQFPLNLMLVGALASVVIGVFGRAKRTLH